MKAKELADKLDGREFGFVVSPLAKRCAKENGLVIVYAYSDDCMEFEGAICDEISCYEGGEVYVTEHDAFEYYNGGKKITAVWHDGGNPCWTFETDISHETFNIYEDGELFCIGIVFSVDSL